MFLSSDWIHVYESCRVLVWVSHCAVCADASDVRLIRLSSHRFTFISRRSALHQASTQPCYLLPTLSPGHSPGAHLSRVPSRTRQPAASDRPGRPPAPGTPPAPHCPARAPSVPGCAGASIPTSGLTPAIPHPAAASRSAAPQDPPALQVQIQGYAKLALHHVSQNESRNKSNLLP